MEQENRDTGRMKSIFRASAFLKFVCLCVVLANAHNLEECVGSLGAGFYRPL